MNPPPPQTTIFPELIIKEASIQDRDDREKREEFKSGHGGVVSCELNSGLSVDRTNRRASDGGNAARVRQDRAHSPPHPRRRWREKYFLAGFPRVALCESRNPGLDDAIPSGLISGPAPAISFPGEGGWHRPTVSGNKHKKGRSKEPLAARSAS